MSEKTFRFVVKRLLVAHVEQRFVIGLAYSADPVCDKNQDGTK